MTRARDGGEPTLTGDELRRYGRHLTLPHVGIEGQRRLKAARILLVGAGGLGSPAALYLAAAGVGTLGIVDPDVVDETNLQRQVLHGTADVGRPKVESARDRIAVLNPHVRVETHAVALTASNAREIIREYDIVIDGSDNFATRYIVNDACVLEGKPDVYGSVFRFEGQVSVFAAEGGPCYRCVFPAPPPPELVPDCAQGGVLGVLPGLVGTIQATEAIKLIVGIGRPLAGRLLLVDALGMEMRTIAIPHDPSCPACGTRSLGHVLDVGAGCGAPESVPEIGARELAALLGTEETLQLLDVREPHEWAVARVPQARLVPLGTLEEAFATLDPRRETVVLCKTGVRSAAAVRRLRAAGFERVRNLRGGMESWREEVDPDIPRY